MNDKKRTPPGHCLDQRRSRLIRMRRPFGEDAYASGLTCVSASIREKALERIGVGDNVWLWLGGLPDPMQLTVEKVIGDCIVGRGGRNFDRQTGAEIEKILVGVPAALVHLFVGNPNRGRIRPVEPGVVRQTRFC